MASYRKLVLLSKCLLYDTKSSYSSASKRFKKEDLDVDVTGHVFLITGANSGIGFATATEIARRGGEVHLVCRNEEKGMQAKIAIIADTGNQKIHLHILDMAKPQDVAQFAQNFVKEHGNLDVLVNNAGEMVHEMRQTEADGLDVNFVTNSLGPYILTQGLLSLIKDSKRMPRVVTVTSAGMLLERLNHKYFDNLKAEGYDGTIAYGQCKRQVTVLTEYWANLYPEIHFSCNHPGWVDTPAAKRGLGEFYDRMKPKFRTPQQGADTVLWLCISQAALRVKSGEYFQDRQVFSKHLPLALTKESHEERRLFLQRMESHLKEHSIEIHSNLRRFSRQQKATNPLTS